MSALARYFKQQGHTVSGYDRTESPLTQQLVAEGIAVHYDDDPSQIPASLDLAIYTPAVPTDTREYQALAASGVRMLKRSQVLGELTRGKKCIAVAGTHGKTTTTAMIAWLLSKSNLGCSAFLGGIAKNFDSNLVVNNESEWVVVEADEYDRSFLQLHPHHAVITSADPDHLDIYGTHEHLLEAFAQFASQVDSDGSLVVKQSLFPHHHEHEHDEHEEHHENPLQEALEQHEKLRTYTARGVEADYYAINVRNYRGDLFFDLRTPNKVLYDIQLSASCLYNVENAVAAAAVALECGLDEYQLRYGLKSFAGIRRRFDYRIKEKDLVYIDDYAHHPKEIEATIESARYLYPEKRIVGIFQPHLYSRTRDLADGFAEALKSLDEVILMPIYPAREEPIAGVSSHMILRQIQSMNKYYCMPSQVGDLVVALCPDVVLTMGAGDIDRLVPKLEKQLRRDICDEQ